MLKIYLYSNFAGLNLSVLKKMWEFKFVGIHTQNLWNSKSGTLSFVDTQNLWVHKSCDDTKFQVGGRENWNICVHCISCEQKNEKCAFSIYALCHMCKNIPCELGFRPTWPKT